MRSDLHRGSPRGDSFIETFVQAVCEIANVFLLLGELIASRTYTLKHTDRSEPPDVVHLVLHP